MHLLNSKPKLIVLPNIDAEQNESYAQLSSQFEIARYQLTTKDHFVADFEPGHVLYGSVAIFADWPAFAKIGGMTAHTIGLLPSSLRLIVIPSTGYDTFDVPALTNRGILLCNTPAISSYEVADTALMLTLSVFRFSSAFERAVRTTGHVFQSKAAVQHMDKKKGTIALSLAGHEQENFCFGSKVSSHSHHVQSPYGKTVGIGGFGKIGKIIGARLSALGMKVHYFKRSRLLDSEEKSLGYSTTYHDSFDSLCKVSELLVLVLPGNNQTAHILNKRTIGMLPFGAKVINVGRGSLINENDLLEGLSSGRLSSVGLDVYEDEMNVNPNLLLRDDVTLTPHIGACTEEVYEKAYENCMENIRSFFMSGSATTAVNQN